MACRVPDEVELEGGYDALFEEELPEFLSCIVCHLALRKPVHIIDCGHRFCQVCFERMKQTSSERAVDLLCPIDREVIDFSKVFTDKGIERVILDLKVKCNNHEKGCGWKGELRTLQAHLDIDCIYELVACEHDGCNLKIERRKLNKHITNCSKKVDTYVKQIEKLSQRLEVFETKMLENKQQFKIYQTDVSFRFDELERKHQQQLEMKDKEIKKYQNAMSLRFDELEEKYQKLVMPKDDGSKKNRQEILQEYTTRDTTRDTPLGVEVDCDYFDYGKIYFSKPSEDELEPSEYCKDDLTNLVVGSEDLEKSVQKLSKKICEEVILVEHGVWYTWTIEEASAISSLKFSPSYLTDDGQHFKIGYLSHFQDQYNLYMYFFNDEDIFHNSIFTLVKNISYRIAGITGNKRMIVPGERIRPFDEFDHYSYKQTIVANKRMNVFENVLKLDFMIKDYARN